MRTQEEIVERIDIVEPIDPLGFEWNIYMPFLDFEHAKKYLIDTAKEKDWGEPAEQKDLYESIKDYMPFAFEKARSERGLSANRSIQHIIAWLWLAGDEFYKTVEHEWETNYHSYGLPILIMVCNHLKMEIPK